MSDKVFECFRLDYGDESLNYLTEKEVAQMIQDKVKEMFPKTSGLDKIIIQREWRKSKRGRPNFSFMKVYNVHLPFGQLSDMFGYDSSVFGNLSSVPFASELRRVKLSRVMDTKIWDLTEDIRYGLKDDIKDYAEHQLLIPKSVLVKRRDIIEDCVLSIFPYISSEPEPVRKDPLFWVKFKSALQAFNVAYNIANGDNLVAILKTGEKGDYADISGLTVKGCEVFVADYDELECCECNTKVKITGILGNLNLLYEENECDHEVYV